MSYIPEGTSEGWRGEEGTPPELRHSLSRLEGGGTYMCIRPQEAPGTTHKWALLLGGFLSGSSEGCPGKEEAAPWKGGEEPSSSGDLARARGLLGLLSVLSFTWQPALVCPVPGKPNAPAWRRFCPLVGTNFTLGSSPLWPMVAWI